ncbi:hypothetical protein DL98DRAFT_589015 [Cadophora sp. DSE1049]|nr:hypothetical protein DL98DRAFT_589015 [Cadophora sp. DSE1049]
MDQVTVNSAIALTAAAFLIILSRAFLRKLKHENFLPDDWLMMVSIVFYVVFTATFPAVVYNGINTTQTEPDKLKDDAVVRITLASKLVLVGRVFYMTYLWCLKGCIKAIVEVIVMESLNISTDVFIMAIPIPLLLRSSFSLKNKIEMSGLFIGGFFIILASVLRLLIVLGDLTTQNKLVWAEIECFVATIVSNAPVLHEMWRHGWGHIRKRRFGKDHCSPEYNLAVRAPTQSTTPKHSSRLPSHDDSSDLEPENDLERRETASVRGSKARLGIRKSVRKINNKLRKSLEHLEIETSVVLVQHSKTGIMTPTPGPEGGPTEDDFFSAPTHGKDGTARIRTEVSCGQDGLNRKDGPKNHVTRFFRGDQGCG